MAITVGRDLLFAMDDGGRRGHSRKLFKSWCRLDIRKFAFSNRIVGNWISFQVTVFIALC